MSKAVLRSQLLRILDKAARLAMPRTTMSRAATTKHMLLHTARVSRLMFRKIVKGSVLLLDCIWLEKGTRAGEKGKQKPASMLFLKHKWRGKYSINMLFKAYSSLSRSAAA